jgi:gamma-glutamylcyclotransferase (GGCT)/AIG2-like uncharacterized protein YtfP
MRRIFVCGSLRKGESDNRPENFGGQFVTTGTISGVVLESLGESPALVPSPNISDRVVGEVYEISEVLSEVIDRWEREAGNEVRVVQVTSAAGEVEAHAYFYENPDPGSLRRG